MLSKTDKDLLKVMEDCLKRYLKAASDISQEAFEMLSEYNGLLWSEISTQVEILEKLGKVETPEEKVEETAVYGIGELNSLRQDIGEQNPVTHEIADFTPVRPEIEELSPVSNEIGGLNYVSHETWELNSVTHEIGELNSLAHGTGELNSVGVDTIDRVEENTEVAMNQEIQPEESDSKDKENCPFYIFDKVVGFMKNQKCDELQWVRTYTYKCNYEGIDEFQIKYFENKDPIQAGKNYLLFGNTRKNYSLRKTGDDLVGDVTECFEIILNLSELFNIG